MLDIVYGEIVSMLWHSCAPTLRPIQVGRRPQSFVNMLRGVVGVVNALLLPSRSTDSTFTT